MQISPTSANICLESPSTHFENISEPSLNKSSTESLQTSPKVSSSVQQSTDFFSSGVKRQFSSVSPSLFQVDLFPKKQTLNSSTPAKILDIPENKKIFNFSFPTATKSMSAIDMDTLSTTMQDFNDRLSRLEEAQKEILRLQTALAESEAARKTLEAQVASLSTTKKVVKTNKPVLSSSSPVAAAVGLPAASYARVAAKASTKKKSATRLPSPRHATTTIARLFGPSSGTPSEYQYVYYSTSTRRPLRELRRNFSAVGINPSRVLDIHYPVARVVAFLLHADYVLDFTTAMHMKGRGSSPLVDFDPCDQINLKDPKFASLPLDLRAQKAREIENLRCLRSLSFVRRSARVSVARSFLRYERINRAQFDAILAEELAARVAAAPSDAASTRTSSPEERHAKKKRLSYLGYLLHHDADTASLLANAPSDSSSPSSVGLNENQIDEMVTE